MTQFAVFDQSLDFVYLIPASCLDDSPGSLYLIESASKSRNNEEHVLCSKCPSMTHRCERVHVRDTTLISTFARRVVHYNDVMRPNQTRNAPGQEVEVFNQRTRLTSSVESSSVLVTVGSDMYFKKNPKPRMQQCTHFQRHRCVLGTECAFLHILNYDPKRQVRQTPVPQHPQQGSIPILANNDNNNSNQTILTDMELGMQQPPPPQQPEAGGGGMRIPLTQSTETGTAFHPNAIPPIGIVPQQQPTTAPVSYLPVPPLMPGIQSKMWPSAILPTTSLAAAPHPQQPYVQNVLYTQPQMQPTSGYYISPQGTPVNLVQPVHHQQGSGFMWGVGVGGAIPSIHPTPQTQQVPTTGVVYYVVPGSM
eukprot:PhF_6_TR15611/c0_g1_i1/m.24212